MKFIHIFSILSLSLSSVACAQNGNTEKNVDPEQAEAKIANENLEILDVRTAREFSEGHLEGARNIDFYSSDFEAQIEALPKGQSYLIYCRSGGRSAKGLQKMEALGFEEVYNLNGGVLNWQRSGKKVVQ